ncbi:hypothetical protein WME76_02265 [Sorangium sp. So ce119]|uniref:hypothetical protein n=1 Tax=Sorangium sp. So ce119 TaxID=3133279 RepID=UPI003F5F73E2
MASGGDYASLERMIQACRDLARLPEDAAPIAAQKVQEELRRTASAGQAPDGTPWAPRKKDGGRAMLNAAKAITAKAIGTVILVTLYGPEVFHHFGAQGKPARHVIPRGSLPAKLGNAIRLGFVEPFSRVRGYAGYGTARKGAEK